MITQEGAASSLVLPRPLVQELLHQAQVARGGSIQALIVRRQDGKLNLRPVDATADTRRLQAESAARGTELYAFCSSSPASGHEPSVADLGRWRGTVQLFLTVALGTKGVLQLRAWQTRGDGLQPMDVAISDEHAAAR